MLLESLNALVLAGEYALQTTCGLPVVAHTISLVRQGTLTFPALCELQIKGGPLQRVHLGCDSLMAGQLAGLAEGDAGLSAIESLTNRFLGKLVEGLDARNPRGTIHNLEAGAVNLVSSGLRSFGFRLDTGVGQLYILAEVPSRLELEVARGSEYLAAMERTYLPRDWGSRQGFDSRQAIDNFLVFTRKVECDVYFELPDVDCCFLHSGVLLDNGTLNGVKGLKFCTDLGEASEAGLQPGDEVRASVGVDERSLQFNLRYLGSGSHPLANGAELPCAFFEPPQGVKIAQRRLAFRIPVVSEIPVEIVAGVGAHESSPWGDFEEDQGPLVVGTLADLSFSGARIAVNSEAAGGHLEINRRVVCRFAFPDCDDPVSVLAVVRRAASRLIDRNDRRPEIGLEFLISQDTDRSALEQIRQFVLAEQRARLSRRIHVSGMKS